MCLATQKADVAADGTGPEMRTSGPKSRPTGVQEWKEQGAQMCLRRVHDLPP